MAFFILIPFYWLGCALVYAASPRQQINHTKKQALIPPAIAWTAFLVLNLISYFWLIRHDWSQLVAVISLLLMNMLLMPACILLLAHHPQWLKQSTLFIFASSVTLHYLARGIQYVA